MPFHKRRDSTTRQRWNPWGKYDAIHSKKLVEKR